MILISEPGARDLERGLPAQIAGRIGRRILQGELKPGDTLPRELDLLAELQVSRTTLREAFAILASNGFIEARQRIGTRVRCRRWAQAMTTPDAPWRPTWTSICR